MSATAKAHKAEREAQERAWNAEQARVEALGNLFSALPAGPEKTALLLAMRDRIIDLYNNVRMEEGDAILEFLPNDFARELLDWYFWDENPASAAPPPTGEYEAPQQGQVSSGSQQPCGTDGQHSSEADAEIVEIAKDLVALWQSPKIQGLPRSDRNAAIDSTRNRLIAAVTSGER